MQVKPLIENYRYWDLSTENLLLVARTAKQSLLDLGCCIGEDTTSLRLADILADQINDACSVMYWRSNNGEK